MTSLQVHRWDSRDGDLTEAVLRLRYLPAWHHRITIREYEPGGKFDGRVWVLPPEVRVPPKHTV
jgi:hypothetical protein